jgi:hypothetical protein
VQLEAPRTVGAAVGRAALVGQAGRAEQVIAPPAILAPGAVAGLMAAAQAERGHRLPAVKAAVPAVAQGLLLLLRRDQAALRAVTAAAAVSVLQTLRVAQGALRNFGKIVFPLRMRGQGVVLAAEAAQMLIRRTLREPMAAAQDLRAVLVLIMLRGPPGYLSSFTP